MTLEEFRKISQGQARIVKPAVEPQLTGIQVKLLKDINVGGDEGFAKAGTIIKVFVPIGTKNPKTVQILPVGRVRRTTLVVGKDVELMNQYGVIYDAPEKLRNDKPNYNWILIGGIVLVGYLILKK